MVAVVICEMFGWTYDEYMDQPQPFLDLIKEKIRIDTQIREKEIKRMNKK